MKLILVNQGSGRSHSIVLSVWARVFLALCFLGLPCGLASLIYLHFFATQTSLPAQMRLEWANALVEQQKQVLEGRLEVETTINALGPRVAELQARIVRLDALGARLSNSAKLSQWEFGFTQWPVQDGPEPTNGELPYAAPNLTDVLDRLAQQIDTRERQLGLLSAQIASVKLASDTQVKGEPVTSGAISYGFGRSSDPFAGKVTDYECVDFSGEVGSDILAIAAGAVTSFGEQAGYGNLVEISHASGFKTRYGHRQESLAQVGESVKKGQLIALIGTTGRSTGTHEQFEVYKNGRVIDPASYIRTRVP